MVGMAKSNKQSETQLTNNPKHEKLFKLEKILLELPQVHMEPEHKFCEGMYARTILIPKGTLLTGIVHRDEFFFIIRSGDIIINDGEESKRVSTGFMEASPVGTKRAGLALDDTIVTTIHLNVDNETDPDKLWDNMVIEPEMSICRE